MFQPQGYDIASVYIQSSGPVITLGSCWEVPPSGYYVWHIGLYTLSLCVKSISHHFVQEPYLLRGYYAGLFPSFLYPSLSSFTYFPAFVSSVYKRYLVKEKEKEKKRKHFIGYLHPYLPSASPVPISLPPLISAPSILFPYCTPLLCTSSILPLFLPACSSRNIKETETYMKNKLYTLKLKTFLCLLCSCKPFASLCTSFIIFFFFFII
jgi:hypothetical protein